jgi:uncharacterized protein
VVLQAPAKLETLGEWQLALSFEWDGPKAASNLEKHGVSFQEAMTVFADALGRVQRDLRHSADEERYVLLGMSERRRILAVMFTERGESIRIISARSATPRERRDYGEQES